VVARSATLSKSLVADAELIAGQQALLLQNDGSSVPDMLIALVNP
jgi:hypothetical protein